VKRKHPRKAKGEKASFASKAKWSSGGSGGSLPLSTVCAKGKPEREGVGRGVYAVNAAVRRVGTTGRGEKRGRGPPAVQRCLQSENVVDARSKES